MTRTDRMEDVKAQQEAAALDESICDHNERH